MVIYSDSETVKCETGWEMGGLVKMVWEEFVLLWLICLIDDLAPLAPCLRSCVLLINPSSCLRLLEHKTAVLHPASVHVQEHARAQTVRQKLHK